LRERIATMTQVSKHARASRRESVERFGHVYCAIRHREKFLRPINRSRSVSQAATEDQNVSVHGRSSIFHVQALRG